MELENELQSQVDELRLKLLAAFAEFSSAFSNVPQMRNVYVERRNGVSVDRGDFARIAMLGALQKLQKKLVNDATRR